MGTLNSRGWNPTDVVLDALVYFDTVAVWVSRYLEKWERDTLEGLCGRVIHRPELMKKNLWMWRLGYKVRIVLHQPTRDALRFLQERLRDGPPPLINRVDCALDFLTDAPDNARALQHFFDQSLHKPWHRPKHAVEVSAQGTTYIGFKNWKSKIVSYSDRPSRHTGAPCCHLEWRFQGHRAVAALDVESIQDLLSFDFLAFWQESLHLYKYDLEPLGKRWNGRHLNRASPIRLVGGQPRNHDEWTANILCRGLRRIWDADKPILMDLAAKFATRGLSLARVLVPIDATKFLRKIRIA